MKKITNRIVSTKLRLPAQYMKDLSKACHTNDLWQRKNVKYKMFLS